MAKKSVLAALLMVVALALLFFFARRLSAVVTVERTVPAPVAKVWALWTEAEAMKKWWGPKGFTAPAIQNDARVDGAFLFSMRAPDGKVSWNSGRYTEVIPHQKLVSLMSFSDETGKMVPASHYGVPGEWPDTVTVVTEFRDVAGQTEVKVTETGIPMIMYVFARMGWEQQLDKFEALVRE